MQTQWTHQQLPNGICLHTTTTSQTNETILRKIVEHAAEKAISLLDKNIQDDSLYLMFEWHPTEHYLHVVVCNAQKTNDAPEQVRVYLQETTDELKEKIQYWLHDYLTTCTAFFRFSLVAIFHGGDRSMTELL